jgi:hypothetical protein
MPDTEARRANYVDLTRRPVETCTCVTCPCREGCWWAFDAYNEDGDCIAEK